MGLEKPSEKKKPKEEKPKRAYVVKNPRPKMTPEERLERRRVNQRGRIQKFREEGNCIKCGREPILINYVCEGTVLYSRKTVFCKNHTKLPVLVRETQ